MSANGEPLHILENKSASAELGDQAHELQDQCIARVVQDPLADHGEALAGRTAKHTVDRLVPDAGCLTYVVRRDVHDRAGNDRTVGEVELVDGAMDWSILDTGTHIEAACSKPRLIPPAPANSQCLWVCSSRLTLSLQGHPQMDRLLPAAEELHKLCRYCLHVLRFALPKRQRFPTELGEFCLWPCVRAPCCPRFLAPKTRVWILVDALGTAMPMPETPVKRTPLFFDPERRGQGGQ